MCTTAGELRIPRRVSPFRGDEGISKKPKTKMKLNQSIKTSKSLAIAALAGMALTVTSAHAVVVFTGAGTATEVTGAELSYTTDVSATDLINGLTATTGTGWNTASGATLAELNDGIHGGNFAAEGNTVQGAWSGAGAVAEYNLGLGASALGYDITSIQTIAAWQGGVLGNQDYKIEVKAVGGIYTELASVDFGALTGGGATKVTMSGLDVTGIESIRFTANDASVFRELDVIGVDTVPEPSAVALLGLGGLALLRRRRRD